MDIQPISANTGSVPPASGTTQGTTAQAESSKQLKDRVDLSGRNPDNKQELMATYGKIRAVQLVPSNAIIFA